MTAPAKVVVTDYVWDSLDVEQGIFAGRAKLVALQTTKPDEFLRQAADCDALLNTYAGPITAEVIAQMPKCLIIARYGIGVDTIDLDAATAAGILVTNNPTYCIDEVAEAAMALMLACARKVVYFDRLVREGRWEISSGKPMFRRCRQHHRAGWIRQHCATGRDTCGGVWHAGAVFRSLRAARPGRRAGNRGGF